MDLLELFAAVLGDDHPALQPLADAQPAEGVEIPDATDEQIAAVAALANLTDDEVQGIYDALRDVVRDESNDTETVIAAKDLGVGIRYVQDVRAEAAEQDAILRAEALAALEDDEDDTTEDEPEVEPTAEDTEPEVEETEQEPQVVAASRPSIRNVANRVPRPAQPAPTLDSVQAAAEGATFKIVDSVGGAYERGEEVGVERLALALADKFSQFGGTPANGYEQHRVAQAKWEYDEDHQLGPDFQTNQRRIAAARAELQGLTPTALTAAICAPPQPIYEIRTVGTEARPVRDFLTGFQATRGGIIYRPGLPLSSAGDLDNDSSGVTIDWSDGDANKFVLSVACPETETRTVQAQVARAEVSNMQGQFDPESVAAALRLQMVLWARGTDSALIARIAANSVVLAADNTTVVGFGRNLLVKFNQMAVGIRNRERMDPNDTLDLMLPAWVIGAFQDDLTLEQPGATEERLATTQAQIEDWFAVRNIRLGWFLDTQGFGTQAAGAEIANYPQQVTGYMFEPGHHLFLDGGELNLGIIRDSTLNDTNEYQTFMETFEGLASPGVVSYAVTTNVCRTGTSGAAAEVACDEIS